ARVRIFTPDHELPFAGHPTLGTAYVLAQRQGLSDVVLETKMGLVPVRFDASGRGTMTQPVPTVRRMGDDERAAVLAAIGVDRSLAPVDLYDNGVPHLYVVLESPDAVANLRPDLRAVEAAVGSAGVNCIAGGANVWKTRMFIPGAGVGEDPATGSAAGPLAVHAARHGLAPWGEELTISQGAEIGRPSTLYATAWGEGDRVDRVEVAGDCVIVGETTFTLPT
ncbi:MAG TPA: PhzF family phenazine biosynthesis protein, partial [Acidimicrobiales bacterium]